MSKQRVFSGIQPSGTLHLGNYLGAIKQWVAHQHEADNLFCVVDLHALTIPEAIEPAALRAKSREVAALYLACGIDPAHCTVFIQSHVREHTELAWMLTCVTPLGWLQRMTQYKSKAGNQEHIGSGLLSYPVLQAADILLYDTHVVPVGQDQKQHIELTRDIAIRFNNLFGETFVVPDVKLPKVGARVMGFDNPDAKMSKSVAVEKPGHAVGLLDTPKRVKKTIMGAKTDTGCEFRFDEASSGVRNLITVYQALSGESQQVITDRYDGRGYGYLKKDLLDLMMGALAPIQSRYAELNGDPAALDQVLNKASQRARGIATETMDRVRKAVGTGAL
jgi:tryptophanyl-tRNA synthetase